MSYFQILHKKIKKLFRDPKLYFSDLIKIKKTNKSEIVNIHKSEYPFGGMVANNA